MSKSRFGMLVVGAVALGVSCMALMAEDKKVIVVSATRVETDLDAVASSISVLSDADIEVSGVKTLPEALKMLPGVHVASSGGLGKTARVYLRGSKSEDVLILIDGVDLNDPVSVGRGTDLSFVELSNIERIEVLRGAQSALYGSDAIGGVINIITKKGAGAPVAAIKAEAGSFGTYRESASLHGSKGNLGYSFALSRIDTDGISVANKDNGNPEKDGYWNTTLSGRLDWEESGSYAARLIVRHIDSESDLDAAVFGVADALNSYQSTEQLFLRSEAELWLMDSMWYQKVGASYSAYDRHYLESGDKSAFNSDLLKLDWQHNLFLGDSHVLTAGVEYDKESGESESGGAYASKFERQTAEITGVYLQDRYSWNDRFIVAASVREDHHDTFGSKSTYRIAPLVDIKESGTKLKATYGTGFKAPSLFQLYSSYGSEDLRPVLNESFDVGVSQELFSKALVLDVAYFGNDYKDMISYDYATSKYGNVSKANTKGVEVMAHLQASDSVTFGLSYTYTKTEDKDTGEALLRIPEDRASFSATYRAGKLTGNISLLYVGDRSDYDFIISDNATLASYFLVDVAGSYDCTESIQIFAHIDNLLDEDYEEVLGYGTPGIGAYAGVKIEM